MLATTRRARLIPSLAAITFVLSLVIPVLTLAAPTPEDPPPNATQCEDGMIWNGQTQECEALPDIPTVPINQPQPVDCPDGQVPNGNGGCIPDQEPECDQGTVHNPQTNECDPLPTLPPPPCPIGQVYDEQGNCVPDQQPPDCAPGFILDADWTCVPDPDWQPPDCPDGEVYDQDVPGCVPVEMDTEKTEGNRVILTYHRCVDTIDPSVDLETLLDTCELVEGAGFEGVFGDRVDTLETGANGQIVFDDLPQGEWTIVPIGRDTDPDDGALQVISDCNIRIGLREQEPLRFEQLERIFGVFDQPSGIIWDCHWVDFVFRDALDLVKYACPAGTDPDANLDDLQATCAPSAGTLFWLMDKRHSISRTTDANGHASWGGLGHSGYVWLLREQVPADYGQPTVWCSSPGGGAWTRQDVRHAQITITYPSHGGSAIECAWFNVLAADQGVFIYTRKLVCPYGTPRDLDAGEWRTACEPGAGVEFTADFDGTVVTRTAGSDGTIEWGELPIGPWTMTESFPGSGPAPYDEPIVFCYVANPPAGSTVDTAIFFRTPTGMSVSGTYTDDHRGLYLNCAWINIRNTPAPPMESTPSPPSAGHMSGDHVAILGPLVNSRQRASRRAQRRNAVRTRPRATAPAPNSPVSLGGTIS